MGKRRRPSARRGTYDEREVNVKPLVDRLLSGYSRHGLHIRPAALETNWRLAATAAARNTFVSEQLSAFGFRRVTAQYSVLRDVFFSESQALSQNEIAQMRRISPANVTRLVQGLERSGLVKRHVHPEDRRSIIVCLTHAGQLFCERNVTIIAEDMSMLVSCFTDTELDTLNDLLTRLHLHIEKMLDELVEQYP